MKTSIVYQWKTTHFLFVLSLLAFLLSANVAFGDNLPDIFTPTATNITPTSAVLGAHVQTRGGNPGDIMGVVIGTSPNPDITSPMMYSMPMDNITYTIQVTGLVPFTTYHFRGFAKNARGISYTADTIIVTIGLPVIVNPTATGITSTGATVGATVTDVGTPAATTMGVVLSTSANPDTTSPLKFAKTPVATGVFTVNATGLTSNTIYHYRGYITNTYGTVYTADATFLTRPAKPALNDAADAKYTGANLSWIPDVGGNAEVLTYRLEVSTTSDFSANVITIGYIRGTSRLVTGLQPETYYYFRVRARNSSGDSTYQVVKSFFTTKNICIQVLPSVGGSVTPNGMLYVTYGDNVTFTATPQVGYVFDYWIIDGTPISAPSPYTMTNITDIPNPHTVLAVFTPLPSYTVTVAAGANGTVSPAGPVIIRDTADVLFTAIPLEGYKVGSWSYSGTAAVTSQTGGSTFYLRGVASSGTLSVTFITTLPPTLNPIALTHSNTDSLTMTVTGAHLNSGAIVQLLRAGQPDITAPNPVVSANGTQISCTFYFNKNALGAWNLVVTNPDGQAATITGAVTLIVDTPHVVSVTPNGGLRGTLVDITDLAGYSFAGDATVKLQMAGQADIPMSAVTVYGVTKIVGHFDLTTAVVGTWNLLVTNPADGVTSEPFPFIVSLAPAPTLTTVTPTSGLNTSNFVVITLTGSNFLGTPTVVLHRNGFADLPITVTSATDVQFVGTIDLTGFDGNEGLWDVTLTNPDGQVITLPQAFAILSPQLTSLSVTADQKTPIVIGSTLTITALSNGTEPAENVEYAFFAKVYNQTMRQYETLQLRGYGANTFTWMPTKIDNYWLFAQARAKTSTVAYQIQSDQVYMAVVPGTLTAVTLAVTPASPCAKGTPITLAATRVGTIDPALVEYRFIYKKKNPITNVYDTQADIRGFDTNAGCTWTPSEAGTYRIYVYARIVGSGASFQTVSSPFPYVITE